MKNNKFQLTRLYAGTIKIKRQKDLLSDKLDVSFWTPKGRCDKFIQMISKLKEGESIMIEKKEGKKT